MNSILHYKAIEKQMIVVTQRRPDVFVVSISCTGLFKMALIINAYYADSNVFVIQYITHAVLHVLNDS